MFSHQTYYKYLKEVVYPTTYNYWMEHQAKNLTDAMVLISYCLLFTPPYNNGMIQVTQEKSGGVRLSGDARFDSPGFSAKYCTYYIQASLRLDFN